MKRLLIVAFLVAACGGAVAPSAAPTPAVVTPVPTETVRDATGPCRSAVTVLGAFTERLAGQLADLRPLVMSKVFRPGPTALASRQVAITLNDYSALGAALEACSQGPELADAVASLSDRASAAIKQSQDAGMTDAKVQRAAAAKLFALLPDVIALSEAGTAVADSLGTTITAAVVSNGADKPLGQLPPLVTPRPATTPKPAATPKPTPRAGTAAPASGWTQAAYNTAVKYTDSTWHLYTREVPDALWNAGAKLFGATCDYPTSEQRGACFESEVKSIYQPIQSAVRSHLAFMNSHRAAKCFADAYTADRAAANAYAAAAKSLAAVLTAKNDAAYEAAFKGWDKWLAIGESRSSALLRRFEGYFKDCR